MENCGELAKCLKMGQFGPIGLQNCVCNDLTLKRWGNKSVFWPFIACTWYLFHCWGVKMLEKVAVNLSSVSTSCISPYLKIKFHGFSLCYYKLFPGVPNERIDWLKHEILISLHVVIESSSTSLVTLGIFIY